MMKMSRVRIAIVGSRSFTNLGAVEAFVLQQYHQSEIVEVVSGGAYGADWLGKRFAEKYDIPYKELKPNWQRYGKQAGFLRNIEIVNLVDEVFAFWDGESKGTKHTIDIATENDKPCYIYNVKERE